jgi:hypothetical protein
MTPMDNSVKRFDAVHSLGGSRLSIASDFIPFLLFFLLSAPY